MTNETTKQENPISAPEKSNDSIINVFKNEFSSSVIPIYLNSLKKEVNFREVSVEEQKAISKTMIQNESRKDMIYDTQCAMINHLCLEEGFDIYQLTEFDRIRILMEIYSSNYLQNTITFKCPECGTENAYTIDFDKILKKFNDFDLKDIIFTTEDKQRIYKFTLNYPTVRNVSNFYKNYMKNYKNVTKKEADVLDNLGNIEYINLFINNIELINKKNPNDKKEANLKLLSFQEVEQLLSFFPQNIIFDDEKGVIKYITEQFIDKINGVFQYEKCGKCGYQTQEGMGSLFDFF